LRKEDALNRAKWRKKFIHVRKEVNPATPPCSGDITGLKLEYDCKVFTAIIAKLRKQSTPSDSLKAHSKPRAFKPLLSTGTYAGFLRSLEKYGKIFCQFPDGKKIFWSVSMEKEKNFPDLIF